jgi:hypothetical protein
MAAQRSTTEHSWRSPDTRSRWTTATGQPTASGLQNTDGARDAIRAQFDAQLAETAHRPVGAHP